MRTYMPPLLLLMVLLCHEAFAWPQAQLDAMSQAAEKVLRLSDLAGSDFVVIHGFRKDGNPALDNAHEVVKVTFDLKAHPAIQDALDEELRNAREAFLETGK
jgi:hypothetical protein